MQQDNYKNIEASILTIAKTIGNANQLETGWIDLTLENGWVVYSSTYATGQYRRDKNGMVHLRGLIKNGTGINIATLPAGFRPAITELLATATSNNVFGRVDIDPSGVIIARTYNNQWLSLYNLHFLAEL